MQSSSPFLGSIRQDIRLRTEKAYLYWIKRYILFHHKSHPATLNAVDVKNFLSWLCRESRDNFAGAAGVILEGEAVALLPECELEAHDFYQAELD